MVGWRRMVEVASCSDVGVWRSGVCVASVDDLDLNQNHSSP